MLIKNLVAWYAVVFVIFGIGFIAMTRGTLPTDSKNVVSSAPAAITQLTQDPASALRPAWSPDNRLIAFESNRDGAFHIYVMDTEGKHVRQLTTGSNDDRHPAWSPDGNSIFYDSSDGLRQDIWVVNLADSSRKQLTRLDGLADYAAPSPDGQQIAFYLYRDMTLNLWSARADGSNAQPLTLDLADATRQEPTMASYKVGWSQDSQWLAFTGGNGRSIWLMRADGSDAKEIIDDGETNRFPWFLADGRLAFITEYVPPRYGAAWTNAWAYDLKTGERTLLQELMAMQEPVAWNAENSQLLFSSPRNGHFDIYLINLNALGGIDALRGTTSTEQCANSLQGLPC